MVAIESTPDVRQSPAAFEFLDAFRSDATSGGRWAPSRIAPMPAEAIERRCCNGEGGGGGRSAEWLEVREGTHLRLLGGERPLDRDVLLLQTLGVALQRGQLRFQRAHCRHVGGDLRSLGLLNLQFADRLREVGFHGDLCRRHAARVVEDEFVLQRAEEVEGEKWEQRGVWESWE